MSDTPRTDAAMEAGNDYETRWKYRGRMTEFCKQLERELAAANARVEELERGKLLADGMANMIRGFIFKTVERETLAEMAAKYRKWEEDYCHRNGASHDK